MTHNDFLNDLAALLDKYDGTISPNIDPYGYVSSYDIESTIDDVETCTEVYSCAVLVAGDVREVLTQINENTAVL